MLLQLVALQQYSTFTSLQSVLLRSSCTSPMASKRPHSSSRSQSAAVKLEAKPEVKLELTGDDVKEEVQEQAEALSQRPSRRAKLEPKADADAKASPAKRAPRKKAFKREESEDSKAGGAGNASSSAVSVFPSWPAPTAERCSEVHEALVQLHGAPLRTKLAETGTDLEKPASTQLVSTYTHRLRYYYLACCSCQHMKS
jgi:hypothetical protein